MFSFKGIPVKIIAAVLALIALAAGVYLTFFHSAGFVKTQASDDRGGNRKTLLNTIKNLQNQ